MLGAGIRLLARFGSARALMVPNVQVEDRMNLVVVVRRLLSSIAACAVLVVAVPALLRAQGKVSLDTVQFAPSLEVDLAASKRVANGLHYRDIIVGTGAWAHRGTEVTVRYVGTLADGRAFTSLNESPVKFKLGEGTVIQGWERGITGMRTGGRRQIVVAPSFGYGNKQTGPIPPNSVLVFDIEVISVR